MRLDGRGPYQTPNDKDSAYRRKPPLTSFCPLFIQHIHKLLASLVTLRLRMLLLFMCISLSVSQAAVSLVLPNFQTLQPRSKNSRSPLSSAIRWQPSRRRAGCRYLLTPALLFLSGVAIVLFPWQPRKQSLAGPFFLHLINLKHICFFPAPRSGSDPVAYFARRWGLTLETQNIIQFLRGVFPKRSSITL